MRITSWYSRTLPPPESESTSLSSLIGGMSRITCAAVAVGASFALPALSSVRFNSDSNTGAPLTLTKSDENAYVACPRKWKPHAATAAASAGTAIHRARRVRSDHDIDEPSRDDDHFLDRRTVRTLRDFSGRFRRAFDRRAICGRRHDELAAQLAVDLQDELDLVLRERLRIHFGPGRVEQIAIAGDEAQVAPQVPRRMRHDRIEHSK